MVSQFNFFPLRSDWNVKLSQLRSDKQDEVKLFLLLSSPALKINHASHGMKTSPLSHHKQDYWMFLFYLMSPSCPQEELFPQEI